jgi:ferritin
MLAKDMIEKLNEQINLEYYSSNLYRQMSAWLNEKGFAGAAFFLNWHAEEELEHMQRLFNYVSETGGLPLIGTITAPPSQFKSLADVFNQTLEHEKMITAKINDLVHAAITSKDYSTFNFLQWYVSEQHEEEKLFKSIIDKIAMIGQDTKSLFLMDKEIQNMAKIGVVANAASR